MIVELQKHVVLLIWDFYDINELIDKINLLSNQELVMIANEVPSINSDESIYDVFGLFKTEILFSASAIFHFENPTLFYYYWKYYPRQLTPYDYLNSQQFIGKKKAIISLLKDMLTYDLDRFSIQDCFHRIYVDTMMGFSKAHHQIKLDHRQQLMGNQNERVSPIKIPILSKIQAYLFFANQKGNGGVSYDFYLIKNSWCNIITQTTPVLLHKVKNHKSSVSRALKAYLKSVGQSLKVLIHNKGESRFYKLFRYAPNNGREVNKSVNTLLDLLEAHIPFCFSHFNDGELTFINKHQRGNHKETWFGRRQNQYTKKLGELLVSSFLLKKENYFVGIPCGKCHPKLRKKAIALRSPDRYTIEAMTLHHNIDKYPRILGLLKGRPLYFVTNSYQDLSFFTALGLKVKDGYRINVPFKNSHKEYDNLKDFVFEESAVILMMCGMLGKVLTPVWFENNPSCSFITFGSSFDDFIQKNINLKLIPNKTPFARHLIGTRSFLFGAKKHCSDCFDLKNSVSCE